MTKINGDRETDDDLSCNLEPLRNEEALLLNILSFRRWNKAVPPPPVWEHETTESFSYKDSLNNKIPFHYCLINNNQFFLCSNSFDCKCEARAENNDPSDILMSSTGQRGPSNQRNSVTDKDAIMGLSKEMRLQRRAAVQLAKQLKNNCDKILSMEIPFVVDSGVLKIVSDAIDGVSRNINCLVDGNVEDLEYHDLVMFLSDFFQQSPSLCIALSSDPAASTDSLNSSSSTDSSKVEITHFKSLQFLELRNTPPSKIIGLNSLRAKLKKLKCSRCVQSVSQILTGGCLPQSEMDSSRPASIVPSVWPELKEIDFSFNRIGSLEDTSAFELCPSVEILNLSRNRIVSIDDKFSRVMNSLSVLNLSYNQLTAIPQIPPNVKTLLLSHNYISTLNSSYSSSHHHISSFTSSCSLKNIEVLDLSTNLISNEENLLPLKEMNNLKKLSLIGNPISFMNNYRNTVGGYLSRFVISRKFELDKKSLSSSEVRWAIEQCKQGKFIPFIPANSLIISSASAAMTGSMNSSTSMQQSSSSSRLDHLKSMTQSYDSSSSSVRSSKRKKPKIREIMTLDFSEGDEMVVSKSKSDTKENFCQKSRSPTPSSSASMSEKSEIFVSETRQAITALREKYGAEHWLLRQAGNEIGKILQIPNRPINFDLFSRSLPPNSKDVSGVGGNSSAYYDAKDNSINRSGRFTNEELLVIAYPRKFSEPSETNLTMNSASTPKATRSLSGEDNETSEFYSCFSGDSEITGQNSQQMEMGGSSIFDAETDHADEKFLEAEATNFESFRIFQSGDVFKLIIFDSYLMEVNPEDSVVLNKWDLNCLVSLEEERCDNETETIEFRLKFDTMRKQMRERSFIMSAKDFGRFDKIVSPYIEVRTLQEFTEALQCTKCYAQFSRAMAGRTVKQDRGGAPREVSICPNTDCGNDVLVTLDAIPLPNNECLDIDVDGRGPLKTSTPISGRQTLSRSIPKGRSPRMLDFLKLLPSSLTSRRNQNNNSRGNSFDEDVLEVGSSAKSITPTSTDTVGNTKSESDIEVLSNDSSSIEVLARHCGDSGSEIDAEEAVELPALDSCLTHKGINKTVIMTESTSSSSCADSIITTYERHLLPISQPLSSPSTMPLSSASASTTASFNSLTSTSTFTGGSSFNSHSHMTVPVRYDYVNFAKTDHRLQLWCEISVFKSADERLLALTKCMIISDSSSAGSFLGIVIFSSRKVYLYRIIGNEGDKPQDWLQKFNAFDLSKFAKLDVLIGRHGVGVDFSGKYFAFVFRDSERTSGFLEFFMSDICGEMDPPPMVRDFSQTQKSMLSPTNPISYFGIMRYSVCDTEKPYPVSAVLLTNEELLLITDLSWMAGRCDIVNTKHGRQLSTLRQGESMESDGTFLRLVFEIEPEKLTNWDLSFETEQEKSVFEKHLREVKADIPFICLSQPIEP